MKEVPISDVGAEAAVIGSIFLDAHAIFGARAMRLDADDFVDQRAAAIYDAATSMSQRGAAIDTVAVAGILKDRGRLEWVGGVARLVAYTEQVATAANVEHYASRVKQKSELRKAVRIAKKIQEQAPTAEDARAFLDQAQRELIALADADFVAPVETADTACRAFFAGLERRQERGESAGVQTGFHFFDARGGIPRSGMVTIGGRPGMGKTAWALSFLANLCQRGGHGFYAGFEMPRDQVLGRLAANLGEVDGMRIYDGTMNADDWVRVGRAMKEIHRWDLEFWTPEGATMAEIRVRALRAHARRPLDALVLDYLQLIDGPGKDTYERVSQVSRATKRLAMELDCPVVALSQLSREIDRRDSKEPRMSDLRESGKIEEDSDVVAFVFRPVVYDERYDDPDATKLIVPKNRNGSVGHSWIRFRAPYQRMED